MSAAMMSEKSTAGPVDAAGAIGRLREVAGLVPSAPLRHLDDERLLDAAVVLEGVRRLVDGALGEVLAEADSRQVTDVTRGMRTGAWVAHETREPVGVCRRRVSVATRLHNEFPVVGRALREGRVTWYHADACCQAANPRVAERLATRVPSLVALASELDFDPWKRRLHELAARFDLDGRRLAVRSRCRPARCCEPWRSPSSSSRVMVTGPRPGTCRRPG